MYTGFPTLPIPLQLKLPCMVWDKISPEKTKDLLIKLLLIRASVELGGLQ